MRISTTAVKPGTYWLAVLGEGGTLYFRDRTAGPCEGDDYRHGGLIALPSGWRVGPTRKACPISGYATDTLTPTRLRPPVNTEAPSVSGSAVDGDILTASTGSWTGSPTSYGYQWEDCAPSGANCTNINGATSSNYTLTSNDLNDTIRVTVTAANAAGATQTTSAAVGPVTQPSTGGLPTGVTLQQIDGRPNYYCSNGFTFACSAGWDNPSFFPIVDDYAFYSQNSTATFKALGLTTDGRVTGGTNMSYLRNAGITSIQATDPSTNTGSETVGVHIDEPASWSDITSQASTENTNFGLNGRFVQGTFTWNQLYYKNLSGSVCAGTTTMTMPEVFSCTSGIPNGQHLNLATADIYWFAGSGCSNIQYQGGLVETSNGSATADQMARGSNYGDMVDIMRTDWLQPPASDAPIAPYIENSDGLDTCTGHRLIQPQELQWAVWSTIVHGARMILYFGTTGSYESTFGFDPAVESGQTVSMETQAQDTNTLVENVAPIINAPFALNYASVTPAGYTFPALPSRLAREPRNRRDDEVLYGQQFHELQRDLR